MRGRRGTRWGAPCFLWMKRKPPLLGLSHEMMKIWPESPDVQERQKSKSRRKGMSRQIHLQKNPRPYGLPRVCQGPGGSDGKNSACSAGDVSLIPGSGRAPGEGNGNPLQYSCLENPKDRGAWQAAVHVAAKSQAQWSNWHFHTFPMYLVLRVCICVGQEDQWPSAA